jgi:oxalate decarboxylase/phosphoglucose isomerase-like protein (cupin superfamily)
MIIKSLAGTAGFQAGDGSFLKELLRPSPETGGIGYSLAHAEVAAGQAVYIPPGAIQRIENPGPGRLAFLCIVEPAWTAAGEEVL